MLAHKAPLIVLAFLVLIPFTGADPTPQEQSVKGEAARALARAEASLGSGDLDAADRHLAFALEARAPGERVAAADLMGRVAARRGASAADPLHRASLMVTDALWTDAFNPRRDLRFARETWAPARSPAGEFLTAAADLASSRGELARSLTELAFERERSAARAPEQLLTAAWARRFALELLWNMPAAEAAMSEALEPRVSVPRSPETKVLKGLDRLAKAALRDGDIGTAMLVGRSIKGLGVQADLAALRGRRPPRMASWRARGAEIIEDAEAALTRERPWTVEELEWLSSDEGQAFTRSHSSFASPGVAVSPRGWYRIESDCGHEALLAAARNVELHHGRLAALFGVDPFADDPKSPDARRQGTIRIVPDPSGLEAEGTPFFWAGGFQSGDLTVVRLTAGTDAGLGRLLTHELTHRFDQVLHPTIPSWLAEGRAVWTAAAYGDATDVEFESGYANFGTLNEVRNRGFAGPGKLGELVAGTPSDYRQNYVGGHGLYVFLSTWSPPGADGLIDPNAEPMFAAALGAYEDRAKAPRPGPRALDEFEATFCDGMGGRPEDFEGFCTLFAEFLKGFDRREPATWVGRYVGSVPGESRPLWIYDEPTWTWDWNRAEPSFGQNQARVAAGLLGAAGRADEARLAYVWARAVDGFDPRTASALEELLVGGKGTRAEALFALRHERQGEPFGSTAARPGEGPGAGLFPGPLKPYARYQAALGTALELALAGGAARTAATLEFERSRALLFMGDAGGAARRASDVEPFAPSVELNGWRDEELVRLDRDRPDKLFQVVGDGTLRLGRRGAREGTGSIERRGGGRSFVRADRWMLPGTYEITAKVRFTTGFNRLFAVVGWQARDRNTRFSISAGDAEFASGETDEEPTFETVGWRFDGMRPRDQGLPGSARGGSLELPNAQASMDVRLLVDGPLMSVWIQGKRVGSYHVIDGQPIEGYVGFGTLHGAVNLSDVRVRRLVHLSGSRVIHFERGTAPPFAEAENAAAVLPGALRPPTNGAIVLTIPSWSAGDPAKGLRPGVNTSLVRAKRVAREILVAMDRGGISQPLWVVVPEAARSDPKLAELAAELGPDEVLDSPARGRVLFHSFVREEGAATTPDGGERWLMFVDTYGVARAVQEWTTSAVLERGVLAHWLTVFRDTGRPDRNLPQPTRGD